LKEGVIFYDFPSTSIDENKERQKRFHREKVRPPSMHHCRFQGQGRVGGKIPLCGGPLQQPRT
jgi:hypothetical protein